MPELRITARGFVPSVALLAALLLLPQLLAGSLSAVEAESLLGNHLMLRATASIVARYRDNDSIGSDALLEAELDSARSVKFASVRVRRSIMVPPFARRTAFLVEARRAGAAQPEYFKVRGSTVYHVARVWWTLRL